MNRILIFMVAVITACCNSSKRQRSQHNSQTKKPTQVEKNDFMEELKIQNNLKHYFEQYRLVPEIELNNTKNNQVNIQLGTHHIKWLNSENGTKIRIDSETIDFKNHVTLNAVCGKSDSVDFVNSWDQIKLFRYKNTELIGIRMMFDPCNGTGCSVNYFLIYDVKTKSKNFFGTFRTDNSLELFDFRNDARIDYVSKSFIGDFYSGPVTFRYQLYSRSKSGVFLQQTDKLGKNYEIDINTFYNTPGYPNLTQHWITNLKF